MQAELCPSRYCLRPAQPYTLPPRE
jgi:hypothetical protein